jgi:hypothetical protein
MGIKVTIEVECTFCRRVFARSENNYVAMHEPSRIYWPVDQRNFLGEWLICDTCKEEAVKPLLSKGVE